MAADLPPPLLDLLRWSSPAVEVSWGWYKTVVQRLLVTLCGVVDAESTRQGVGTLVGWAIWGFF
jgi:hypothetical protein